MSIAGQVLIIGPGRAPDAFSWDAMGPRDKVKAASDVLFTMAEHQAHFVQADTGPAGAVLLVLADLAASALLQSGEDKMRLASLALAAIYFASNETVWCLTLNTRGQVVRMVAREVSP